MSKEYTIIRAGEGTGPENIAELTLDQVLWEPDCGIRAGGRIFHDGENLLVSLRAKEKDIRAEYTAPMSPVHEDSCLEFFFMPEGAECYLNFEINPNGCLHIGFGKDRYERERIVLPDAETYFRIRTGRTAEGWKAEYRIPGEFLQRFYPDFRFAGKLKANVYKCGDKTVHPHYLAWNPVDSPVPDYHRPESFGTMIFE